MDRLTKRVMHVGEKFPCTERARDRVELITSAALDVLFESGFDRVNFETVGKQCRMRRSHVAYYFKSREDLLEAVFRSVVRDGQAHVVRFVGTELNPEMQLRALITGHFDWAEKETRKMMVMMLFYFEAIRHPRFAALHQEIRDIGAQRLQALVQKGRGVPADRALAVAKNIQAIITGNIIDHFSTGRRYPLSTASQWTLDAAMLLWHKTVAVSEGTTRAKSPRTKISVALRA